MRALACVLLAAASAACTRPAPRRASDVVVIVIDTLRADHLPLYGYARPTSPNLDAFAREAVTYEHAITPGTWTVPSHGSLFTGRWPSYHGAERIAADHNLAFPLNPDMPTLAELLRNAGLHTAAFVGNGTYVAEPFGFARGFDEFYADGLGYPPSLSKKLAGWVPDVRGRMFVFVNILDPHEPYDPPPPLDTMFPTKHPEFGTMMSTLVYGGTPVTPPMQEHFVSQYDGEIVFADRALGDIFRALRSAGRYDDALIVVTSDHGEFLGEHGLAGHGVASFEPEVHVPLVVKYPGGYRAGEKVSRRVSTLGVFATVLQAADVLPPEVMDARPLDEPQSVWVEDIDSSGVRIRVGYDGDQKLVVATDTGGSRTWLYDLARDPAEQQPVRAAEGAASLRAALHAFGEAARPASATPRRIIDPEREVKLRALGYIH